MKLDPIPLNDLIATGVDLIEAGKVLAIIRSSSAIVSLISSSALVWMIKRSRASFTTIYNRILLGMAISDIVMSLGACHFNFTAPSDGSYYVWNASGNQLTCSIQGFMLFLGSASGLLYSCSLNLYSLAVVKYQKPDRYIRSKLEPFLHGVPIAYAFIINIAIVAKQHFNDGGRGNCGAPIYKPPHCIGYEDGQTREGFDIPCGRGHDGVTIFFYLAGAITAFIVPLTIGISLGMIHRSVSKLENNMASYGASRFSANGQQPQADRSKSRIVMHRAIAYSAVYFLAWSGFIIGSFLGIANVEQPELMIYLGNLLNPLQGFFNFVIYIYPKVMVAKSRGDDNMTWFQALKIAFWGGVTGRAAGSPSQPRNTQATAVVVGDGTTWNRNETTTDQLSQDNAKNLDNKSKGEDNCKAATADDADNGYKKSLAVPNVPLVSSASDSGQP